MARKKRGEKPVDVRVEPMAEPTVVMGERVRLGYPFRSIEQQAMRRVTPYSNYEGGEERDIHHDVTGMDWPEASDIHDAEYDEHRPHVTRLVKPTSGRHRGQ